jgi:hypothetical protein
VVDDRDRPLAGALVLAMRTRPGGAPDPSAAGTAGDRSRRRSVPLPGAGAAIPGELVALTPAALTRTDSAGRFALPVLRPGRYVLVAVLAGPPPAASDGLVVRDGFRAAPLRLVIPRRAPALL